MATDSMGTIKISTKTWSNLNNFSPSRDLLEGLKALAQGAVPTFNQEAAIEALWHEIWHNRQKPQFLTYFQNTFMEMLTQWVARWTYPEMVQRLGFDPRLLKNHKRIIEDNYGYKPYISNFRKLLHALGIAEEELIEPIRVMHETVGRSGFFSYVLSLLAEKNKHKLSAEIIAPLLEKTLSFSGDLEPLLTKLLQ